MVIQLTLVHHRDLIYQFKLVKIYWHDNVHR